MRPHSQTPYFSSYQAPGQLPGTTPSSRTPPPSNIGMQPQAPAQQRYIYPPPDTTTHGNEPPDPIVYLTAESTASTSPYLPGPQPYTHSNADVQSSPSLHDNDLSLYPPQVPFQRFYRDNSIQNSPPSHTEPCPHNPPSNPQPLTHSSPEIHHDSPPPRVQSPFSDPSELDQLRGDSLTQLAAMFEDYEKTKLFEANYYEHRLTPNEVYHLASLRTTRQSLLQDGHVVRAQLLAQLNSQKASHPHHAPPQPSVYPPIPPVSASGYWPGTVPNGPTGMGHPPLFPMNVYEPPLQQVPPPVSTSHNFRHSPQLPATPVHPIAQPTPVKAAATWGLAQRITNWLKLDPQIPLVALKLIKPLSVCADRHSMGTALLPDNLKHVPHALEWLARYDKPRAAEVGLYVLLHFVEHDDIVPNELTDTLLSSLDGIEQWPRDVKDVGLILSKLRQQPEPRFYDAVNALIGRLLCPAQ